jgi:hypothetical protein
MTEGPWFFAKFGGGWTFTAAGESSTTALWRYTFTVRPAWLAPIADRVGCMILGRDIRRRIDAFAAACLDPFVVGSSPSFTADPDDAVGD